MKTSLKMLKNGDIMVGGFNLDAVPPENHAPIAIKACGISCVIAKSLPGYSTEMLSI